MALWKIAEVFGEMGAFANDASVARKVTAGGAFAGEANAASKVTASFEQGVRAVGAFAEESNLAREVTTISQQGMTTLASVNDEKAMTIKPFLFLILVFSLYLVLFLGFLFVRRRNDNPRRLNNGNIQPDEEQQMLVGNSPEANPGSVHHHQEHSRHCFSALKTKLNFGIGTPLALLNFILEIPPAVFDQIASDKKGAYVLIVMLLSFASMLFCLFELVYNGRKQRITWKRSNTGRLPWFYHPPPATNKPFGTLTEMIGLFCVMAQCIISTINFSFYRRHHAAPIKMPVMPIIFSLGVLCSRFIGMPKEDCGESRTSDQDGGDVALNQATLEPLTPAELQQ